MICTLENENYKFGFIKKERGSFVINCPISINVCFVIKVWTKKRDVTPSPWIYLLYYRNWFCIRGWSKQDRKDLQMNLSMKWFDNLRYTDWSIVYRFCLRFPVSPNVNSRTTIRSRNSSLWFLMNLLWPTSTPVLNSRSSLRHIYTRMERIKVKDKTTSDVIFWSH